MDTQPQIGAAVQLSENPNVTGYVRGYTASRGLTIVEWDSGIREKIHHSELTPNPHERDLDPSVGGALQCPKDKTWHAVSDIIKQAQKKPSDPSDTLDQSA